MATIKPSQGVGRSKFGADAANVVHADENWRQRIHREQYASNAWKTSWGFLECEKPGETSIHMNISSNELSKTISKIGPCYEYLQTERRTARERAEAAAQRRAPDGPSRYLNSTYHNSFRGGPPSRSRRRPDSKQQRERRKQTSNSNGNQVPALGDSLEDLLAAGNLQQKATRSAMQWEAPTSARTAANTQNGGEDDDEAPVFLDTHLALGLQPQYLQGVGMSLATEGVDPTQKYRFPQTQAQMIGWKANSTLEFFGVKGHGRKGLDLYKTKMVGGVPL